MKLREYFLCAKKTKIMTIFNNSSFNDVLTTFLGLELVSFIVVYVNIFHQKYLNLSTEDECLTGLERHEGE